MNFYTSDSETIISPFCIPRMNFSLKIINWYNYSARQLPWRETQNPYHIWLSEIILQQTRVNQGLTYYLKFVKNYPTITDLANAPLDQVLKDWQGLGYYSRARNLHQTAQYVRDTYNGIFPESYKSIRDLRGIGDYTAAAIASFAFGLPYPTVDGNVFRVISRYFDIATPIDSPKGKKEIQEAVEAVFDTSRPALFNQALMEFGAMYCKPGTPDCENCVLLEGCLAYANKTVAERPVKAGKIKVRPRNFHYFIVSDGKNLWIRQRGEGDIWTGLFEFPLVESNPEENAEKEAILLKNALKSWKIKEKPALLGEISHILSHQKLRIWFYQVDVKALPESGIFRKVSWDKMDDYAVPVAISKGLEFIR